MASAAVSPDRVRAVRRKTALADAALLALVALLTGVAALAATRLYSTAENRYVKEAFPIRSRVNDTIVQMLNQETAVRGFLITSDHTSLQPYELGRTQVKGDLAALRVLAKRRPEIADDVAATSSLVRQLEAFYAQQISLVNQGRRGQLEAQHNVLAGTTLFDRFRHRAGDLSDRADAIVAGARSSQRRTFWSTLAVALIAGTCAAGIAVWLLLSVPKRIWSLYDVERELREAAERGDRASRSLTYVDDAVILLDDDDRIRYWNPAAATYLGVSERTAIGRPLGDTVPEQPLIEQALARERSGAVVPVLRNAVERWLVVRESRFAEGRVLVLQDVTGELQLERARRDFLATASHELRTPLAAVYGAVRTLRREDRPSDPELDTHLLAMIESEAHRLAEIVEQILVSSELDRDNIPLQRQATDVSELARSVVDSARVRAPGNIELSVSAPNRAVIDCDPPRLRQVLVNLLDNAVKYSPDGGRVEVSVAELPHAVAVEVADQGIGVPEEVQGRIFEKFFRVDPEMRRGVGGSGLGLYISRGLVERMGGRLRLTSSPGSGSTFRVELPR
ncbi:MAG TPA: ATP-binding protein [Gaiellaceae bacterium]